MSSSTPAGQRRRGQWVPVLIIVVFFTPVLVAWLLNVESPAWLPTAKSNHGELFKPPVLFPLAYLKTMESAPIPSSLLQGKWTLVYLEWSGCSSACERAVYRMRQVRHALGKDMQRIQPLLVSASTSALETAKKVQQFDRNIAVVAAESRWFERASFVQPGVEIYLVDPQGYLVLSYIENADPSGLISDLKRLLKISKIG